MRTMSDGSFAKLFFRRQNLNKELPLDMLPEVRDSLREVVSPRRIPPRSSRRTLRYGCALFWRLYAPPTRKPDLEKKESASNPDEYIEKSWGKKANDIPAM